MNSYPIFKTTTRITLDIGHTLTYGCPVRSLDIRELEPTVKRAAAKMAQKYFLRLSRRRVVCPEDLENVGWVRVFSQIRHITTLRPCACVKMKGCTHRRGYVYRLVCNAIHNEMRDISANGDDAVRLTPQGTTDTGAKDSSYDGGPTVFGTDESAPAAVVPSCEYWTPPVGGLSALRARVFLTVKLPKDGSVNLPSVFSSLMIASIRSPATRDAATPLISVESLIIVAMNAFVMASGMILPGGCRNI